MLKIEYKDKVVEISETSEEQGFLVRCYPDGDIRLYEIPLCSEKEWFTGSYKTVNEAINVGRSWT